MLDVTLKGYMTPKYTIHASSLVITFFSLFKVHVNHICVCGYKQ